MQTFISSFSTVFYTKSGFFLQLSLRHCIWFLNLYITEHLSCIVFSRLNLHACTCIIFNQSFATIFRSSVFRIFPVDVFCKIDRLMCECCIQVLTTTKLTGNSGTTSIHSGQANPGSRVRAYSFRSLLNSWCRPTHLSAYCGFRITKAIGRSPHLG